jgi:hypothetical protein
MTGLYRWLMPAILVLLAPFSLHAQAIRGIVINADTEQAILTGVRVELLDAEGRVQAAVVTRPNGAFHLLAGASGTYWLRATHTGFLDVVNTVTLLSGEELSLEVRLSTRVIALEPVTVIAKQPDPRHDATYDGMLARYTQFPPIGNRRVLLWHDPEMRNSFSVNDLFSWLTPARIECTVVFWNGHLASNETLAQFRLEDPMDNLDAVEFYRRMSDAPFDYQQVPIYQNGSANNCTVVALWSARYRLKEDWGHIPFHARFNIAAAMQQVSGRHAPGSAPSLKTDFHWPFYRGFSVGIHAQYTSAPIDGATLNEMAPDAPAEIGAQRFTTLAYGIESRLELLRHAHTRPVLGVRLSMARRSFNPYQGRDARSLVSSGRGVGVSAGVERNVTRSVVVHATIDHDRLSFDPFYTLERAGMTTTSAWNTTAFRIGIGYSIVQGPKQQP